MFKACFFQLYQKVTPRKFSSAMTQWLAFSALLQLKGCISAYMASRSLKLQIDSSCLVPQVAYFAQVLRMGLWKSQ